MYLLHRRGVTIVEFLLVFVILGIIGFLSYREFSKLLMDYRLKVSLDRLHSDIIQAKEYSIMKTNHWGIRTEFGKRCYVIFEDRDRNCRLGDGNVSDSNCIYTNVQVYPDCANPTIDCIFVVKLPSGIQSNLDRSIVFDKKGYPRNAICGLGMNTLRLVNYRGRQGDVIIDRYGRTRLEYR